MIALLGVEELGAQDRRIVGRARRLQRFLTQPFAVTEAFTGMPGRSVPLADTLAGCRAILAGEADAWQESSLYMIGGLDEARRAIAAAAAEVVMRLLITDPTVRSSLIDADVTSVARRGRERQLRHPAGPRGLADGADALGGCLAACGRQSRQYCAVRRGVLRVSGRQGDRNRPARGPARR